MLVEDRSGSEAKKKSKYTNCVTQQVASKFPRCQTWNVAKCKAIKRNDTEVDGLFQHEDPFADALCCPKPQQRSPPPFSIHVSPTSEKKSDTRADVIVCPSLSLKNAAVHVYNDFSSQVRADEAEWHRRTDVSFAPLLSVFTLNVLSQVRDEVEWQRS